MEQEEELRIQTQQDVDNQRDVDTRAAHKRIRKQKFGNYLDRSLSEMVDGAPPNQERWYAKLKKALPKDQ